MQITNEKPGREALATDKSAAALGLDEFSLFSRIQTGEINPVRARSGEMMIPESELKRIAGGLAHAQSNQNDVTLLPDHCLGIARRYSGLKRNGEVSRPYKIFSRAFSENDLNAYRVAASAVAQRLESVKDLNQQLSRTSQVPESGDFEINSPQIGHWEIRSALLNLNHGEIVLGQRGEEFAVIERFREDSPYAQSNGNTQILMQANDPHQLVNEFKANARLTLEFMTSDLTAKAQKIAWEQFPNHRPGEVVAAISERCHQAIASEEMISQAQKVNRGINRGISM
jgi:hypothetical protein